MYSSQKSMIYSMTRDDMHIVCYEMQSSLNQALSFPFHLMTFEEKSLAIKEVITLLSSDTGFGLS